MNLSSFDLNLLKAADALLTEQSVTRAADRIGVTQQAMSGQLKRLREIFDDAILVQTGRSLVPTVLGRELAAPIRDVLQRVERTLTLTPASDLHRLRRTFVVHSRNYASTTILPTVALLLAQSMPQTRIAIRTVGAGFVNDLKEGRCDLCFLVKRWSDDLTFVPDDIRVESLFEDEWVCVVDIQQAPPGGLNRENYLAARHVVTELESGGILDVQRAWIREGIQPTVAVVQSTFADVLFTVPGTGMIGTVQDLLARRWAPTLGLAVLPPPFPIDRLELQMLWHERDDQDPAHAVLRDAMRRASASLVSDDRMLNRDPSPSKA